MAYALIASLCLGAVMALGDFAWAALHIKHRVVNGVLHGAAMCLCLGLAIGIRAGKPLAAAIAGPVIGVIAALVFYALARPLGWSAMFPAWMLLWVLFAVLQQKLENKDRGTALMRGIAAALLSGAVYDLGICTRDSHHAATRAPFAHGRSHSARASAVLATPIQAFPELRQPEPKKGGTGFCPPFLSQFRRDATTACRRPRRRYVASRPMSCLWW